MITNFVIFDPFSRSFIRQGRGLFWTNSLNNAKHFTSEWSAHNFIDANNIRGNFGDVIIKRIERY